MSECCRSRRQINTQVQANKGKKPQKMDDKKLGMTGIKNAVVKANLMGVSEKMNKKGWVDSQGRKGKVYTTSAYSVLHFFVGVTTQVGVTA